MAKQFIKGFIHFEQEPWMDKPKFSIMSCDMSSCGYVFVGEQEFEADIPPNFNPIAQQIAALEQKKKDLRAKLAKELMEVDDRINSLQSITYEPSEVEA